jgi:hypothetical protein
VARAGNTNPRGSDLSSAILDRARSALVCRVCGGELARRGHIFECEREHVRLLAAGGHSARSDIVRLREEAENGTEQALILKLPNAAYRRWENEPENRKALNEMSALASLAGHLPDGRYRVPVLAEGAVTGRAILMEEVAGPSLENRLYGRQSWIQPRALAQDFAEAARWLTTVSSLTRRDAAPFEPEDADRTRRLLTAVEAEAGLPAVTLRLTRELAARLAERLTGRSVERSLVHHDHRPSHVFVTRDGTTVIDFEMASEGWTHRDAASFLAALDGFAAKHPARRLSPGLALSKRSFLAAYRQGALPGWDEVLPLFLLEAMVSALFAEYQTGFHRRHPRVFRAVVVRHYDRWFRRWHAAHAGAGRTA